MPYLEYSELKILVLVLDLVSIMWRVCVRVPLALAAHLEHTQTYSWLGEHNVEVWRELHPRPGLLCWTLSRQNKDSDHNKRSNLCCCQPGPGVWSVTTASSKCTSSDWKVLCILASLVYISYYRKQRRSLRPIYYLDILNTSTPHCNHYLAGNVGAVLVCVYMLLAARLWLRCSRVGVVMHWAGCGKVTAVCCCTRHQHHHPGLHTLTRMWSRHQGSATGFVTLSNKQIYWLMK